MDKVVVVSNIPKPFTKDTVQRYFKDAGQIFCVEKITADTAFVIFKTYNDAVRAVETKHRTIFGGTVLRVRHYLHFFSEKFWYCDFTETTDYFEIKIGKCAVDKLIGDVALRCTISDKIMRTRGKLWLRLPEHVGITFLHGGHRYKVNIARSFFKAFQPLEGLLEKAAALLMSRRQKTFTEAATAAILRVFCVFQPLNDLLRPVPKQQHSLSLAEIVITGVSPAHFAVLLRSSFLKEWFKDHKYGQEATLEEGANSVKIKVSKENVHNARDTIIRYIENLTEQEFSVSHPVAKMYEGKCAKEWVQQRLDESGNVCQWKLTENILTVLAHKADHPALREFFEAVFRKHNIHITEAEPLHSDEWNRFLPEITKQNREDQPNPVVQISGRASITIVDIPSNIDSTIAAVLEFLARNTVIDSNKAALPEKVTTDLQTAHTNVSSSPCTAQETLEQTISDTVLTTNDEDVKCTKKHADDCRLQLDIEAEKKTKNQQEIKDETCSAVRENTGTDEDGIPKACLDPDTAVLHSVHNQHGPVKQATLDFELKDEGDTRKQNYNDEENLKMLADVSRTTDRKEHTKEYLHEISDGIPTVRNIRLDQPLYGSPCKRTDAETKLAESQIIDETKSSASSDVSTMKVSTPPFVMSKTGKQSKDVQLRDYERVNSKEMVSTTDANKELFDDQSVLSITTKKQKRKSEEQQGTSLHHVQRVLSIEEDKEEKEKQERRQRVEDRKEDQSDHLMPRDSEQNNCYPKQNKTEKDNTRKLDSENVAKEDKVKKNENDEKYKPDNKSATEFNESHGPEDSHHDSSYKPGDPKKTCMDSDSVTLSGVGHDRLSRAEDTITHSAAVTAAIGAQQDSDNTSLFVDDVSIPCPGLVGSDSELTLCKFQDEGAVSATNRNLQEPAQSPDDGSLLCKWTNTATSDGCTSGDIPEVVAEIQDTPGDNADSGDEPWKQLACLEIDQLMSVARFVGISDHCVSDLRSRYAVDEDFRRNLIDRCATTGNTSRLCVALLLLFQKYSIQKKQAQSLCGAKTTRPAAEKEPPSSDNPTLSSSAVHPVNYDINRGQCKHFDSDHNLPHARTGHGSDSFMQHHFTGPHHPLTSTFAFPATQNISRSPSNMSYRSWGEQPGFMNTHYRFDQVAGDWSGSFPLNTVPKTYVQGQRFASETGHQSQQAWTGVHTEAASPEQTQLGYLQSHRQRNRVELSTEPRWETSAKFQMDPKFSPALTAEERKEEAQAATSPQQQSPCCHHRTDDEMNPRFAEMEQRMRETLAHMELQMQTRTEVQFQMWLQTAMDAQELVHQAQRHAFETRQQAQMEARLDHLGEQIQALHTDVFELKQQRPVNRQNGDNVLVIDNGSETTSSAPSTSVSEHNMQT